MSIDLPHALSSSRFVLGVGFVSAVLRNDVLLSLLVWLVACATDLCDGWLARRWGSVSARGARLDTLADFVFLVLAMVGLLFRGLLPLTVPAVSAVMFGRFWLSHGPLVYDPIGKYYGTFLFGLVGIASILDDEAVLQTVEIGFYLFTAAAVTSRWFSGVVGRRPAA